MAQNTRQTKLFAAEDYTVVYDSFINANLQAYDFDTIRSAMVDYVRNNYPENYNDWIESSEFVALLDVVAQFGHNLAFRVDLNTRNNFLSTAERQESIFKLAEFLGYTPRRNVPAFGEMKVVSVKTNESVIGSDGTSLGGKELRFENTSSVNNMDDFITVINALMQDSNSFGSPVKQTIIDNITYQFYGLKNNPDQIKFTMQGSAAGRNSAFNAIGLDIDDRGTIIESTPDRQNTFTIVYKNDGQGVTSNNTGFFVGLKQGDLQSRDFTISDPISNMKLDIDVDNINFSDVWVSTVNSSNNAITYWTKVENVYGQNEIYNVLPGNKRNIFSVKTRENNQISVCFSDSNFGNLPKGNIRVWFRTSVNQTYTLRPDDLGPQKITINYTGSDGNQYQAVLGLQLKAPVVGASSSESAESIKENAPRNYSAQGRMVTSSDYNNLIQTQSNDALKTKSINRTHSGHSRFHHTMDPTGAYTSVNVYNKDGKLFAYNNTTSISTASNESYSTVFNKYVKNILNNSELLNLYYTKFTPAFDALKPQGYPTYPADSADSSAEDGFKWQTNTTSDYGNNNGYLVQRQNNDFPIIKVGQSQSSYTKNIEVGSLIEFATPKDSGAGYTTKWAKVVNIFNDGLGVYNQAGKPTGLTSSGKGSIVLDTDIQSDSYIKNIYPAFNRVFSSRETQIILEYIENKKTFAVYYNHIKTSWEIFEPNVALDKDADFNNYNLNDAQNNWLIWFDYNNDAYNIIMRTIRFEFNSENVEFSNITNEYELDTYTLKNEKDTITILNDNFEQAGKFFISGYYTNKNGVPNSNRVIVSLEDGNNDVRPDNPRAFDDIAVDTILFDTDNDSVLETLQGKENLRFEWQHNPADNVLVDPSFTNVIDVFVLSKTYNDEFKQYLLGNRDIPNPSTSYQLSKTFSDVENKKAMSDSIVYRSVTYKPLFGNTAQPQLRAKFRVIKLNNTNVTDNDVKTRIIEKINEYFAVENWDFGETFYFTELAAYIHKELSGIISSFVIVPQGADSVFGDLFEIKPSSSEMFIPDVKINDIDIIDAITDANIRAGQ